MFTGGRRFVAWQVVGALGVALALNALPAPASAQGFFESLFGGFRRAAPPPPQATSFADPFGFFGGEPRRSSGGDYSGGGGGTYCVRTCDGRFFPIQRHASTSAAELCKAFCPAAQTMIFTGGKIDYAVGSNGRRYADLDNAFAYRDRVVDNCTCNGKDPYGLVRIDTSTDPTLRPGDIVATKEGLVSFNGGKGGQAANFTPINPAALPGDWRNRLSALKITPVAPQVKVEPVADDTTGSTRKDRRRVQVAR